MKAGAYALDCRSSILHHNPTIFDWGPSMIAMSRDVELLMLGMVEIQVVHPRTNREWFFPTPADPYYLYLNWAQSRWSTK